MKVAGPG